jgi:hypothetical protein
MGLKEIACGVLDWLNIAEERLQWRDLVNTVINCPVTLKAEISLAS